MPSQPERQKELRVFSPDVELGLFFSVEHVEPNRHVGHMFELLVGPPDARLQGGTSGIAEGEAWWASNVGVATEEGLDDVGGQWISAVEDVCQALWAIVRVVPHLVGTGPISRSRVCHIFVLLCVVRVILLYLPLPELFDKLSLPVVLARALRMRRGHDTRPT